MGQLAMGIYPRRLVRAQCTLQNGSSRPCETFGRGKQLFLLSSNPATGYITILAKSACQQVGWPPFVPVPVLVLVLALALAATRSTLPLLRELHPAGSLALTRQVLLSTTRTMGAVLVAILSCLSIAVLKGTHGFMTYGVMSHETPRTAQACRAAFPKGCLHLVHYPHRHLLAPQTSWPGEY